MLTIGNFNLFLLCIGYLEPYMPNKNIFHFFHLLLTQGLSIASLVCFLYIKRCQSIKILIFQKFHAEMSFRLTELFFKNMRKCTHF